MGFLIHYFYREPGAGVGCSSSGIVLFQAIWEVVGVTGVEGIVGALQDVNLPGGGLLWTLWCGIFFHVFKDVFLQRHGRNGT